VLAKLAGEVFSIEIVPELAETARKILGELGYANIHVRAGDGFEGWTEHGPFDAIIVTCAPENVPQPLKDQLKIGGRMIIPVGGPGTQSLYLIAKDDKGLTTHEVLSVRFVPMTGKADGEGL
jgi:protein-L-isoaspartate(D-aspartate) O-methyltransferase